MQRTAGLFFSGFINNKKLFWVTALFVFGFIVLLIDYLRNKLNSKDHWDNVLVEMHGMVMDIIVFGILITIYEEINEGRREKKKLMEEIKDFQNWGTDEASNRIMGAIKKLNRKGITQIELSYSKLIEADLSHCKFNGAEFNYSDFSRSGFDHAVMRRVNIRGSKFFDGRFLQTDMQGCEANSSKFNRAKFSNCLLGFSNYSDAEFDEAVITVCHMNDCDLRGVSFYRATLNGTKFTSSDLRGANFKEAEISYSTDFNECIVNSKNWIEEQEKRIKNFHCLAEQYFVDEKEYTDIVGNTYYKIAKKENIEDPVRMEPDVFKKDNIEGIPLE